MAVFHSVSHFRQMIHTVSSLASICTPITGHRARAAPCPRALCYDYTMCTANVRRCDIRRRLLQKARWRRAGQKHDVELLPLRIRQRVLRPWPLSARRRIDEHRTASARRSMNTHSRAPRLRASMPQLSVPANRSSTRRPSMSAYVMENRLSLHLAGGGPCLQPLSSFNTLPLAVPVITRIVRYPLGSKCSKMTQVPGHSAFSIISLSHGQLASAPCRKPRHSRRDRCPGLLKPIGDEKSPAASR